MLDQIYATDYKHLLPLNDNLFSDDSDDNPDSGDEESDEDDFAAAAQQLELEASANGNGSTSAAVGVGINGNGNGNGHGAENGRVRKVRFASSGWAVSSKGAQADLRVRRSDRKTHHRQ